MKTTGSVEITSQEGNIYGNNGNLTNITASRATLSAVNGNIYSSLETAVNHLEAVAYGLIDISNTGDLIIGGIGALEGIQSTNSRVSVRSYGGIEVQENVNASDYVLLVTEDSDVASPNENILVRSGVTLQSENSYIAVYSDDDLTVEEQATLQTFASDIALRVNYNSIDGVGGALDLAGNLITQGPSYRTYLYGSPQSDSFRVVPSLESRIYVDANQPVMPAAPGDELVYYIPQGETALVNETQPGVGTISFSGSYDDISYNSIETKILAGSLLLEGTAGDDVLTVNATDANSGTFQLNDGPTVTFMDLSDLSFHGLAGDDRLVINHPVAGLFAPVNGIVFDGGDQTSADKLEILGGSATSVKHRFVNENDGSVYYNGLSIAAITYTGLEPVLDTIAATDRSFTFTGGAESITLSDDGEVANDQTMIDSDLFGEVVTFLNPSGNMMIITTDGYGADNLNIEGVDANFSANLTIQADTDATVHFQGNSTNTGTGNVDISAGSI
ncbi:MAG: hypothetical protein KDA74_13745, partial [Planctomycetaceae bacterium]|nr:hypothetical protein [Planctomycetaceae bacterium]